MLLRHYACLTRSIGIGAIAKCARELTPFFAVALLAGSAGVHAQQASQHPTELAINTRASDAAAQAKQVESEARTMAVRAQLSATAAQAEADLAISLNDKRQIAVTGGGNYDGQLRGGRLDGLGILVRENGRFAGDWADSQFTGLGVWQAPKNMPERSSYEGRWLNSKPSGLGVLKTNVFKFEGQFEGWALVLGVKWFLQGQDSFLIGDFSKGKVVGALEGVGVAITQEGERYEGEFRDDKRHGFGILTPINGPIIGSYWENGRLIATSPATR